MAATIDLTHEGTVLVAMESTACDPHHTALPELSGFSSITSQVVRVSLNLLLHVVVLGYLPCVGVHRMSLLMDVSSSFEFSSEFVPSARRSSTTMKTRLVSAGLDVSLCCLNWWFSNQSSGPLRQSMFLLFPSVVWLGIVLTIWKALGIGLRTKGVVSIFHLYCLFSGLCSVWECRNCYTSCP